MLKMILIKLFGGCNEGKHDFDEFLIRSIPPRNFPIAETSVQGMEIYMEKATEYFYEIRCHHCGKKPEEVR